MKIFEFVYALLCLEVYHARVSKAVGRANGSHLVGHGNLIDQVTCGHKASINNNSYIQIMKRAQIQPRFAHWHCRDNYGSYCSRNA